jgi:lysozyme
MKISERGIEAIKRFESLHDGDLKMIGLQPKMCPAGYWTEGYGSLILDNKGNKIQGSIKKELAYKYAKIHNEKEAEDALKRDLATRESMINSLQLKLTQGQFDALVDFCYNVGFANLKASTLLQKIKANINDESIKKEFLRWSFAGGKQLKGLIIRRQTEAEWFFN